MARCTKSTLFDERTGERRFPRYSQPSTIDDQRQTHSTIRRISICLGSTMEKMRTRYIRPILLFHILPLMTACSFLPGFGIFEDPALYFLPVGAVANQVACELQEFMSEHESDPRDSLHRWQLANEDASVKLALQTDSSGYVNFTGINVAQVGLQSIASFITTQAKVPTLAAKLSGKRTRTVTVSFFGIGEAVKVRQNRILPSYRRKDHR